VDGAQFALPSEKKFLLVVEHCGLYIFWEMQRSHIVCDIWRNGTLDQLATSASFKDLGSFVFFHIGSFLPLMMANWREWTRQWCAPELAELSFPCRQMSSGC
jgi:hypothetical protein